MFKNLTYKQRFFAVIAIFIVLSLASYKRKFKDMLVAKRDLTNMENKLSTIENSFNDIYNLKNEIDDLDNLIGGQILNPELVQGKILDFISKTGFDVGIASIADVHLFSGKEFLIYSNQIEIEGTYKNLVNTLYGIEKNFKSSRVASTRFYSKMNYKTNTKHLFLKIILQNYEKAK